MQPEAAVEVGCAVEAGAQGDLRDIQLALAQHAAGVFKAMGQGSGIPSLQAYAVKSLDKERSGVAVSTIMIGQNVGNALAPIAGSFFVKSFGYEGMFCGFGAVMLVGGLILLLCQYKKEKGK